MYTVKTINELLQNNSELLNKYHEAGFKLCFVSHVEEYESVYTKKTKEYLKSEQYEKDKNKYRIGMNPHIEIEWVPSKRFIPGFQTHEAYFTPIPLSEQWGDDFNDVPYEHNAGIPYDTGDKDNKEHEILIVPFTYPDTDNYMFEVRLPEDYGNGNSPWSVDDINLGAIPWLFGRTHKCKNSKLGEESVSINAGDSPLVFITRLIEMFSCAKKALDETNSDYGDYKFDKIYKRGEDLLHAFYSARRDRYIFINKEMKPVALPWDLTTTLERCSHLSTPDIEEWNRAVRDLGYEETLSSPSKKFLKKVSVFLNKDPWTFYEN